ncbi:hypothetical protein OJF2_70230 [Aquisphaera giovannonii]|uniref:TRAM domain-containing protein n=1 Tax=Aquisphaera giovannonii TaxID=406548 RepID=A0A5B9WCX0_9BACT|nr:hypothetical protein [Aquisphaera giovannonii]QEH38422.1 hypothetical protein OJF2_70230 [Aquisphaera giovannonii]
MMLTTVILLAIPAYAAPAEALAPGTEGDETPLVVLSVLDEETGRPVERFLVLPGVPYSDRGERPVANWQPHLVRESTGGRYTWPEERSYETFQLRVEADGYRPSATNWLRRADGFKEVTLRLRRDHGTRGVVLSPDGSPAAGATIGVALTNRTLRLKGRAIDGAGAPPAEKPADRWQQPFTTRANAAGKFRLTTETDPAAVLVVVHESGYLEGPFAERLGTGDRPTSFAELRLRPWGRIQGRLLWGDRPGAGEPIELIVSREWRYPDLVGTFASARSGADGRFEFKDVPPGRVQIARLAPTADGKGLTSYQFPLMHLDVPPGEGPEVVLGGRGRVVAGRLTGLDSYEGVTLRAHPTAPHVGLRGDDEQWSGWMSLRNSPAGATVFRDAIAVAADGTFRIEGLVPGSYQVMTNGGAGRPVGGKRITVEPAAGGRDAPGDLVEIRVTRGER